MRQIIDKQTVTFGNEGLTKVTIEDQTDYIGFGNEAAYSHTGTTPLDTYYAYWSSTISKRTNWSSEDRQAFLYYPDPATFDSREDWKKHVQKATSLTIHSTNGKHIRLHITDRAWIDHPHWQNKFCHFLSALSAEHVVDILVGNSLYGANSLCNIGMLMDALNTTAAQVTMHMCGRGSMCETCLWLNTQNKAITPFGSLCLCGVGRILETYPMWRGYYETIFVKGKQIGLLTDNDIVSLLTTNRQIYIGAASTIAAITNQND